MQHRQRNRRCALILILLLGSACGQKKQPHLPRELAEFHAPVAGQVPYFKGNDMNPYWAQDNAPLPAGLRQLKDFSFTAHDGSALTAEKLRGKLVLVSFFFTRCSGICPMVTANVKRMREHIKDQTGLIFLSVTVDPEHDGAKQLSEFRNKMQVPLSNWYFATGSKAEIYDIARSVFQSDVTVRGTKDQADFLHTESVYLLDQNLYLRGIYRTRGLADSERLAKEVAQLRAG